MPGSPLGMKASQLQTRTKKKIVTPEADEASALGADGGLREVRHLLDEGLPEELELARHARRRLPGHQEAEAQDDRRRDQRGPHDVEVDRPDPGDVHDAPVLADRDGAAGEDEVHWMPCDMTMRPTLTTKSSWKITRPATAPMPSGAVQKQQPDADQGDDAEARHALGAHGAAQHLVADTHLALRLELGDTGVEKAQVHDRQAQPDDETERAPKGAEERSEQHGHGADDQGGHDGPAQHLGRARCPGGPTGPRAGS